MPQEKPEVLGISEDAFIQWKHNPVTKALRKFMEDFTNVLKENHVERWMSGDKSEDESEARGRAIAIDEIRTLEFHHIFEFYAKEAEDEGTTDKQD